MGKFLFNSTKIKHKLPPSELLVCQWCLLKNVASFLQVKAVIESCPKSESEIQEELGVDEYATDFESDASSSSSSTTVVPTEMSVSLKS